MYCLFSIADPVHLALFLFLFILVVVVVVVVVVGCLLIIDVLMY